MLTEYGQKVKSWLVENKQDLYTAFIIFLVGLGSFGLGRLSVVWPVKEPLKIKETNNLPKVGSAASKEVDVTKTEKAAVLPINTSLKGKFVASKSGISFHYPWCPGALKIKEENKIWLDTKEEAESRGYKPAGNCPGL